MIGREVVYDLNSLRSNGLSVDQYFDTAAEDGTTPSFTNKFTDGVSPESLQDGKLLSDVSSADYEAGVSGWIIKANGDVEFNDGDFRGNVEVGSIDIGGSDTTSAHIDSDGNFWLGSATFADAPARISNQGYAVFENIAVGGDTIQYVITNSGIFSFGDGSDGDATLDGTNTFAWASLSSGEYTLTRDVYLDNLTLSHDAATNASYDAVSNSAEGSSVTSRTWSHTCSGSDRILIVGVAVNDTTLADRTVSGITYKGIALTKIRSDDNGTSRRSELWYLINPPTGSNSIIVTMGGTCTALLGMAVSLNNVDQRNPIHASNGDTSTSGASASAPVTTTASYCMLVDVLSQSNSASAQTAGTSQTSRVLVNGTNLDGAMGTKPATTVGAEADSWTWTGGALAYALSSVAIRERPRVRINTGSYRVFVRNTATISGNIHRNGVDGGDGGNASGASGGGAGSGGSAADGYLKGGTSGSNGGGGGSDGGSGTNGTAGSNVTNSLGLSNGAASQAGGVRSGSGTIAGNSAAGGTATAANVKLIANWHLATLLDISSTGATVKFTTSAGSAGGGGGGGAGGGSGRGGGGGGGGGATGGIVAIYARNLILNDSASITAYGGNGGHGGSGVFFDGTNDGGNGGGGGGANGGIVVLVYNDLVNNGMIAVNAGVGGYGGSIGGNNKTKVAGDGSVGVIYQFELSL